MEAELAQADLLEILQEAKINDLSANTIIGNNILANNIQSNQLNSQKITAPLVCLNNKCLSDNTIKTLLFESSRINDYMYLPEQCVLWSNLKPYINNDISDVYLPSKIKDILNNFHSNNKIVIEINYK